VDGSGHFADWSSPILLLKHPFSLGLATTPVAMSFSDYLQLELALLQQFLSKCHAFNAATIQRFQPSETSNL
jgi:hypothetical protein